MQRARILEESEIELAARAIRGGELVGMPTETVYGLAGNAFDVDAVTKIFTVKERPSFDPLIVHVADNMKSVEALHAAGIIDIKLLSNDELALTNSLIKEFWPGPLTIILPKGPKIPDLVTSGLSSVGIRMPAHPLAQKLLKICGMPLAAPSANRFGRISPTTSAHVDHELGDRIPFILEGGPCAVGVESTVITIGTNNNSPHQNKSQIWLIRPGKISSSELQPFTLNPVELAKTEHEKASPGMLLSHYAPQRKMICLESNQFDDLIAKQTAKSKSLRIGLLVPAGDGSRELKILSDKGLQAHHTILLSPSRSDQEAARNLFAGLRALDNGDIDLIITGIPPTFGGLWLAISDRLKRACHIK